jgi:pimeloyl-ACP methyl ester carboxylesterase
MPYAEVNDIRMYYEEAGSGEALLLLHGATGAVQAMSGWPMLADRLAERHRVFSIEHRGHGRTNNPAGSLSYALVADDIARCIEQIDLAPAHLAGVSDGATIGMALAMQRPELLRSLVCIGANIYLDDQLREALAFFDPELIEREHPEYAETFAARHDPHRHPGYWKELVRLVRSNAETELAWGTDDLARIPTPTLLIFGENDVFVSRQQMLDMRDWLPNAELLILNHAGMDGLSGHLPQFTRPDVIALVMEEFLGRHAASVGPAAAS